MKKKEDPRVDLYVNLWKKHYSACLGKCNDCGGFSVYVCETALRKMLASQLNGMDKEILKAKGVI